MIDSEAWPSLWRRYLDQYLSAPPRTGFWIDARLGSRANSFLELGCGSGRDSLYLAQRGHRVVATDMDGETLRELQSRFPDQTVSFRPADAKQLDFPDDSFDVVFHNGLWVLFEDDEALVRMAQEQARVARKFAVVLVHNRLNPSLVREFQERSRQDELFAIRFFSPDELGELIERAGLGQRRIRMLKFGGRMDRLYTAKRIKRVVPNLLWPLRHRLVPRLYELEPWERIERIACVVEL